MNYTEFLQNLDIKLQKYFDEHKDFIHCKIGCSACCENGDYPLSQMELEYLMQGFAKLDDELKQIVQNNFKSIQGGKYRDKCGGRYGGKCGGSEWSKEVSACTGYKCPFLINKKCSVYRYRPIICRTHGLAYLSDGIVKTPYCANEGKNYSSVYKDGYITLNPIKENLNTPNILKEFNYGEIRNLRDWIN